MKFELFVARKIQFSDDNDSNGGKKAAIGIIVAITGIAISLVVMMLSISIMLGFKDEIRAKVLGFDAMITVYPPVTTSVWSEPGMITLNDSLRNIIGSVIPDARLSLTIVHPAILKTPDTFKGIVIRGIQDNEAASYISGNVIDGRLPDYNSTSDSIDDRIVISRIAAKQLSINPDDRILTYFFDGNNVRARNFTVAAIYDTHFGDYDAMYAFMPNSTLQKIAGVDSINGSAVYVNWDGKDEDITPLARELQSLIYREHYTDLTSPAWQIANIHDTGALYFNWLELLDTNVTVILILMALVSGFTLISSLFIIILERVSMIGLLKALGASNRQIREIFIIVAQRIVLKGLVIGNIIGIGVIMIQRYMRIIPLDPEAYYLDYVPVDFNITWLLALNIGVIAVSLLMLIVPSHLISTISPAKAIRYE